MLLSLPPIQPQEHWNYKCILLHQDTYMGSENQTLVIKFACHPLSHLLVPIHFYYIYLVWVLGDGDACCCMHVKVNGQLTGVSSHLPLCEFWVWNPRHQIRYPDKSLYLLSHLTEQFKCLLLELTDLQVICYLAKSSND